MRGSQTTPDIIYTGSTSPGRDSQHLLVQATAWACCKVELFKTTQMDAQQH